jgi:hypothetical protein
MAIPPEYLAMNREQLVGAVWGMTEQNVSSVSVDRLLRLRQMESEEAGAAALVAATQTLIATTDSLVAATKRLGTVTYWLMAVTGLLAVTAAADFVLTLFRSTH